LIIAKGHRSKGDLKQYCDPLKTKPSILGVIMKLFKIMIVTISSMAYVSGINEIKSKEAFYRSFNFHRAQCSWKPHPLYSVFTQYDASYYIRLKNEFLHKYQCFYAVSKTIGPKTIIELGTHAGSSADAYMHGARDNARYIGYDTFGETVKEDGTLYKPYEIATELLKTRGFTNYQLIKVDLRSLTTLAPYKADLVVVDAGHDFENEYADLKLAITANPSYIFVDDAAGEECNKAIQKFLQEDLKHRVEFTAKIAYIGGGLVIKLKYS
jgi:predicted O-methyltransferase YrrM